MQRIRYHKIDSNNYVSPPFVLNRELVSVFLFFYYEKEYHYCIKNNNDKIKSKGTFTTLTKAKKEAKKALKKLGVKFYDEVRATRSINK